jgi:hypothetical protein
MATTKQTHQYDRGYEGAIEGHEPRGSSPYYLKGYAAGLNYLLYRCESGEEVAALCQREAAFLAMTTGRR